MTSHLVLYHAGVMHLNNAAGAYSLKMSLVEVYFPPRYHVANGLEVARQVRMGRTVQAGPGCQFGGRSGHLMVL